jgi:uncharacterized membrane-anchored protein YjiN (DUF445 family)
MSGAQSGQSLRAALAADPALRRKINEAVATAAYNVAKEAGITVTAADVEDARSTLPLASSAGQSGT